MAVTMARVASSRASGRHDVPRLGQADRRRVSNGQQQRGNSATQQSQMLPGPRTLINRPTCGVRCATE